jgi:hypothetical protein
MVPEERLSSEEKSKFFKYASKNFGRTALFLSGGAGFGMYFDFHFRG